MRWTSLGFKNEEGENLKLMLDTGVITEPSSDCASAPVFVRKKDGTARYITIHLSMLGSTLCKPIFFDPGYGQWVLVNQNR